MVPLELKDAPHRNIFGQSNTLHDQIYQQSGSNIARKPPPWSCCFVMAAGSPGAKRTNQMVALMYRYGKLICAARVREEPKAQSFCELCGEQRHVEICEARRDLIPASVIKRAPQLRANDKG